jgi:uncharacterized membrane protein
MAMMAKKKQITLEKVLPWMLIVGGIIGNICSFVISVDKIKLLENPAFKPSCDLNPIVSCGSVMSSHQGSLFGFPNPWLGLAGFSVLLTIGVAILAGAKFKRWFWLGLEAGIALGLIFAFWLLFESVYRIHALCPYCLTVDVVVITLAWYNTLYLIEKRYIVLKGNALQAAQFARKHHLDILVLVFLILIGIILKHFWYYYGHYL